MKAMIIKLQVLSIAAIAVALGAVFVAVLSFGSSGVSAQHPMEAPKGFDVERQLVFLQVAGREFRAGETHRDIQVTNVTDGWVTVVMRSLEEGPAQYLVFPVGKIEFYELGLLPQRNADNSSKGGRWENRPSRGNN
ncbi:MAG: hypothetical protein K8I27_12110 [Planctomycetes bacterium]|nr:hypothetical protein [Planctomycetota bacterium]